MNAVINRSLQNKNGDVTKFGSGNAEDYIGPKFNYKTLDDETSKYYYSLSNRLNAPFEDDEEKEIFLKNCMGGTVGEELNVSCDRHGGEFIAVLLQMEELKAADLLRFCRAFSEDFSVPIGSPAGSKVIEISLIAALRLAFKENEDCKEELLEWILSIAKFFKSNLDTFIAHVFGRHVLSRLFRILAGKSISYELYRKTIQDLNNAPKSIPTFEIFDYQLPDKFGKSLKGIAKRMFKRDNVSDYANEKLSSIVMQDLLRVLSEADAKYCQKIIRKIIAALLPEDNTALPENLFVDFPSHLLRSAICLADEEGIGLISQKMLPHLEEICKDNCANHSLQELILSCKSKEQFESVFDATIPHLDTLYEAGFHGTFANLSRACLLMDCCQAKLMKKIQEVLKVPEGGAMQKMLVSLLITLKKYDEYSTKGSDAFTHWPFSIYGSCTIQNMLQFHKTDKIVAGILSLPAVHLIRMITHSSASFVFDTFFSSPYVGEKKAMQLITILKPELKAACSKGTGPTVLVSIFEKAPLKIKVVIAEALSSKESEPGYNKFVNDKLKLKYFRSRRQEWTEAQSRIMNKRKIMTELFKSKSKRKYLGKGDTEIVYS